MESTLGINMLASTMGHLIHGCAPWHIVIHTECPLVIFGRHCDWVTISPNIISAFSQREGCSMGQWILCVLPLQSGESPLSPSVVSHSDSASSTQSLSHGGVPELLVGLSYNATTGRLSVEMIKGSHFRNLAANRAPGEYESAVLALGSPEACKRSCLFILVLLFFVVKHKLGMAWHVFMKQ